MSRFVSVIDGPPHPHRMLRFLVLELHGGNDVRLERIGRDIGCGRLVPGTRIRPDPATRREQVLDELGAVLRTRAARVATGQRVPREIRCAARGTASSPETDRAVFRSE